MDFTKTCRYAYRGTGQPLAMPAVVVFRPDETIVARTLRVQDRHTECADYVDRGLTLFADFTLPTRGFETSFQDKTPAISARRVHLRLEPGKPVTVSLLLFGHEGDWRPGLGHLVERYPDFFVVADPRAPNLHGAFMCSGGFKPDTEIATDQVLAEWKRQHVQTVEVHGTFPFYGRYLPPAERWTTLADDRWHLLRKEADPQRPADDAPWKAIYDYVAKKSPPAMTVAAVRDYINRLHGHGMHALVYFNPTEAWKLWIKANYPGDLVLNDKGRHVPEWYESLLVCPNPDSPWGQYLLDTFKRMMDLYPEADGFFMDQSTYDRLDYAHDDGWSIQDGRTAYRMGWAIDQFSQRCRAMAKARGKFLWWNGPYISDIAYYAEGMMAEAGDEKEVHTIQYLMMGGRACCTLSRTGETTLQDCAAYGIYPTVMEGPAAQLASRYWPIFELFRGKRWVFNAHALDLPQGTKGNLWRLPDGNALVDVVTAGRTVNGRSFDANLPVTVRLPDAAEFRAAYFLSPDLLGKRRLAVDRGGDTLRVSIPRHRSVSAILLAKTGVHLSLEGPVAAAGGQGIDAAAVLDNWTDHAVGGKWTSPAGIGEPLDVPAGQSARTFHYQASEKRGGLRQAVTCRANLPGTALGGDFEFYID